MTKIDPASGLDRTAMGFAWKVADRALLEFAPDMGPIVRSAIVTGTGTVAIKAYVEAMSRRDALEGALQMTDADGWVEHDGKGMPVDGETMVEVRCRNGHTHSIYPAKEWDWGILGDATIAHYRVWTSGSKVIIGYANPSNVNDSSFTAIKSAAGRYTMPVYADAMLAQRDKK